MVKDCTCRAGNRAGSSAVREPLRLGASGSVQLARLAGVEPAARGFEVREGGDTAAHGASHSVTLRGVGNSAASPNVSPHPDNHGQFAALVLQGFSAKLVSPREAAALLCVSRETIYRLCARGELPHVRVGSLLRVDLAAYLRGRQRL